MIPVSITVLRGWAGEAVISAARLVVNLYRTQIVTAAASLATARAGSGDIRVCNHMFNLLETLQQRTVKETGTTGALSWPLMMSRLFRVCSSLLTSPRRRSGEVNK